MPAGFAARVNLTLPLATLLGLAERPGVMPRIGAVDPDPEANTSDRYRNGGISRSQYPAHQRARPLPDRVGNWCASPTETLSACSRSGACDLLQAAHPDLLSLDAAYDALDTLEPVP
jgi:hypothetical protein